MSPEVIHGLTHSFLLSGDDLPECGTCQCPLTVKRVSLIKSMILCASILSNKSLIEEATKSLFRTSLRSTHSKTSKTAKITKR